MTMKGTPQAINTNTTSLALDSYSQAITGGDERAHQLAPQIRHNIRTAREMDIIVSFLMESGVRSILPDLRIALNNDAHIRLLSGTYLGITQPTALRLLYEESLKYPKNLLEVHLYGESKRSFHAKAYMFHHEEHKEIFIGSSNLSNSALTSGIEWNYRFSNVQDDKSFTDFAAAFEDLFNNHSNAVDDELIKEYWQKWHCPHILKDYLPGNNEDHNTSPLVVPRGAQIEALCALEKTRKEGSTRALIVAATGIGKTYLAAFDSKKFNRILFVAHREEILKQAQDSFIRVRGCKRDETGFFCGNSKESNKNLIFAGVQTLGRKDKLCERVFAPDYFDYIVIDEFHHAAAESYKRILNYFKPKFLLGLTATPERLDGKSIYALTEHNVPFSIDLFTAINHGLLVPFHYYAVYDYTVDYTQIDFKNGRYVEKELENSLSVTERHELVFKYYSKYPSSCALGFCVSCKHAEETAAYFNKHGVKATAVTSNSSPDSDNVSDRKQAISKLRNGELAIIFCVDMFNEGVDIPEIDMVLLLRPTESPVIFFQQLGRGLRLAPKSNKKFLNVIDFIGNYKKAGQVFSFLGHLNSPTGTQNPIAHPTRDILYPDDCIVDADIKLIDIIQEQQRKNKFTLNALYLEYLRIKRELNPELPAQSGCSSENDSIWNYGSGSCGSGNSNSSNTNRNSNNSTNCNITENKNGDGNSSSDSDYDIKAFIALSPISRLDFTENLDDDLFEHFSGKHKEWPLSAWFEFRSRIPASLIPKTNQGQNQELEQNKAKEQNQVQDKQQKQGQGHDHVQNRIFHHGKLVSDLTSEEQNLLTSPFMNLLTQIEAEKLNRSYKLPVIMSFIIYNEDKEPIGLKTKVGLDEILQNFKDFYANSFYQQDLGDKEIIRKCQCYEKITLNDFKALVRYKPIQYLTTETKNRDSLFHYDDESKELKLNEFAGVDTEEKLRNNAPLAREFEDICKAKMYVYFRRKYNLINKGKKRYKSSQIRQK